MQSKYQFLTKKSLKDLYVKWGVLDAKIPSSKNKTVICSPMNEKYNFLEISKTNYMVDRDVIYKVEYFLR